MTREPSSLDLFGTKEPRPGRTPLKAGPLTAVLEDGNLRDIRYGGIEVVRAVNYLARDRSWGTYKAQLSNLEIEQGDDVFAVAYDGLCSGPDGSYAYRMTIKGDASGHLVLRAEGEAQTDFPTNRTGFVVLHPAGAAGEQVTIRHSDGEFEDAGFPRLISADQPAFDITALTHHPVPEMSCTVEMEGDAFEMEDQRNWGDASFKTYVRPLAKPKPYVLAQGTHDVQRVSISVTGEPPSPAGAGGGPVSITIGEARGAMPSLALFVDSDWDLAGAAPSALAGMAQDVIVRLDVAAFRPGLLSDGAAFATAIGARLAVQAVFDARDPAAEAALLARAIREADVQPSALLVAPRREFKSRPSGTLPPGEAPVSALVDALRQTGLGLRIGAGTPSYFTEFNRNPPGVDGDFVFFGVSGTIHAADDISVMETLETYPALIESARELCPGMPIWLGPCTIGARHNPYGTSVASNPFGERRAMAGIDPRHGALFGAAYVTGIAAKAAAAGVERLVLAAPAGMFGLLDVAGRQRPLHGVHAELSAMAGAEHVEAQVDRLGLAVLACRTTSSTLVLAANLTPEPIDAVLDRPVLAAAILEPESYWAKQEPRETVTIGPYRTMMFTTDR